MYTQCPKCHSIFTISQNQLAAREGLVRCGHCLDVFNASWNLVDTLPENADTEHHAPAASKPSAVVEEPDTPELDETQEVYRETNGSEPDTPWSWGLTPEAPPPRTRPHPEPPPPPPPPRAEVTEEPALEPLADWEPDEEIVLEAPEVRWEAAAEPHLEPPMESPELDAAQSEPAVPSPPAPEETAPPVEQTAAPETDDTEAEEIVPPLRPPADDIRVVEVPPPPAKAAHAAAVPAPTRRIRRRAAPLTRPTPTAQRRSRTWPWYGGSLVLLALFVTQATYFYFDDMARMPALRPQLEALCRVAGCAVPSLRDVDRIDLVETRVVPHPHIANALRVTATLVNRAPFVQPFPLLEVSLTNRHGQTVARRTYTPAEYLGNKRNTRREMPTNTATDVVLDITNPDRTAMGYEVQLVEPYPKPRPRLGELFGRLHLGATFSKLTDKLLPGDK